MIIESTQDDKELINALEGLSNIIYIAEPLRDISINERMDSLCKIGIKTAKDQNDIDFYNLKRGFALNNGGAGYYYQGNYYKAIQMYTQGLELQEEVGNDQGVAAGLNNIGMIYIELKSYENAMDYCQRALDKLIELNDSLGMGALYDNLGTISKEMGDTLMGYEYTIKGYNIRLKIDDEPGLAISSNNLGSLHQEMGNRDSAFYYFNAALELSEKVQDNSSISTSYYNLASLYFETEDYSLALSLGNKSLKYAEVNSDALELRAAYEILYLTNKQLNNYKTALEMHELFLELSNEIVSQENQEKVISEAYRYDYEKQAAQDSIQALEEKKVQEAKLEAVELKNLQKERETFALYGGVILLVLIGVFIYNRLRITKQQKEIIEEQKLEVEEQRQEILDSINYAKRIQSAILPPDNLLRASLDKHFVLYLPKDIVAGDFYWMEQVNGSTLFAAADCTGHGVPGAMVSVVCNNGLNRSVREYGLSDPGKILDKTREIVIQEFEKSEEEVKDGMDIALCSINGDTLNYAGANNPIWILRKDGFEIEETKANKQPIGKYADPLPFTTHEFELSKGDRVFIFTDGYQDQFGGEKGKKFKAANVKKLLVKNGRRSIYEMNEILEKEFRSWKGNLEQIDDVCFIGYEH